jgi:hypothetical protein
MEEEIVIPSTKKLGWPREHKALKFLFKNVFISLLSELVYFPFWWYSRGLKKTIQFCKKEIKAGWRALALRILITNLPKPMWADYTKSGRVISIFIRLIHLCWRIFLMLGWVILILILFIGYIAAPILIILLLLGIG